MTVVLVHGNPETPVVWDRLLEALERAGVRERIVRLAPPGFGAALPEDFSATPDGYRDWLVGELEAIVATDRPVDLVGHDLGGSHTVRVAMSRPDLLRSWVSDTLGAFEPDYVWHELAQRWQTPGVGEADVAERFGPDRDVDAVVALLVDRGMPEPVAARVVAGQDEAMGRAVLRYYRAAVQPVMAEAGARLPDAAQRPGLAVLATADHVVGDEGQRRRAAARAGARLAVLEGLGHWWMAQDPVRGAQVLVDFWKEVAS
ncbi:alpha/beta hydrolase [Actinomycetospora sp. NBRC 106375]|uniref:alpha/beta fold hydrolase n=1 Tax=Actinomycetospora sp. NBRC 106375 TaxID=3032207 RepID=UPI0024A230C4|nr:alpha/beta hydrolase [Actinomycetospora sp. NBRC 106375]GLZ48952.1 alpha/beta hydrolase [Actinomycetospora sp. NBRC 106375]